MHESWYSSVSSDVSLVLPHHTAAKHLRGSQGSPIQRFVTAKTNITSTENIEEKVFNHVAS